jgi:hypothetical protein
MKLNRTISLLLAGVVLLVFGVEVFLSVIRTRDVTIAVSADKLPQSLPTATPQPEGTPTPEPSTVVRSLTVAPDGQVLVEVLWSFRVGPRFSSPLMVARITNEAGQLVANGQHKIQCDPNEPFQCHGSATITMKAGIVDGKGEGQNWQRGKYTLTVTRAETSRNAVEIFIRDMIVAD